MVLNLLHCKIFGVRILLKMSLNIKSTFFVSLLIQLIMAKMYLWDYGVFTTAY